MTTAKISLQVGLTIEAAGTILGLSLLYLQAAFPLSQEARTLTLLAAQFSLWYFTHCPIHFATGRLLGIRFLNFRVAPSAMTKSLPRRLAGPTKKMPVLGLTVDKTSVAQSSPLAVAIMYASATISSILIALLIGAYAFQRLSFPYYLLHLAFGISNAVVTLLLSPRVGDLSRALAAMQRIRAKKP